MRKKKKGYSLLMAIQAVLIITVLAAAMVTLAATSYKSSVNREKVNKLKLRAESGIEKQYYLLKEYIINNPIVLVDSKQYNLTEDPTTDYVRRVNETIDGIKNWTEIIEENGVVDTPIGRKVDCLKIESYAQYEQPDRTLTGRKVKVTVYIDKNSIYNDYFDAIFKNVFTTSPKRPSSPTGAIESSFYSNGSILNISGNMFLQGKVDFLPIELNMSEGNIKVKAIDNEFRFNTPSGANTGINRYKDAAGSLSSPQWKDKKMDYLYFCSILDPATSSGANAMAEYTSPADVIYSSDLHYLTVDNTDLTNVQNTVTYKIKSTSAPINFQWLINGTDGSGNNNGIYYEIVKKLNYDYGPGQLSRFGEYYKIILVDGDLEISDDTRFWYNNYIIYCSGKVTFKGQAFFYNSSIFAKEIKIQKEIVFNGINTRESRKKLIGGNNLKDFKESNKGAISAYLLKNLEGYGDFLRFRVVKWMEE
ncbi:type II secretion system protein [Clostridium thermarum]|uniref:type II secretion system protein n=1 Tax=Clostridium thermarum TaxID=1716543 RepID=UPI0011210E5C|nr:type II secretion system protein [Clostridium thermarum]